MSGIQFPSMTSKSPSKRISQFLAGTSPSSSNPSTPTASHANSPAWNEKPPWKNQEEHEQFLVDSQVSISSKLAINACPPGIELTDVCEPSGTVVAASSHSDEYHSCHEDLPQEKALDSIPQSQQQTTDDQSNQLPIINPKDISTLFEMIGDITENMKSITTMAAIIPSLETEMKTMSTQISAINDNVSKQLREINARVLVNEEDIEALKHELQAEKTYTASHVKPAIRKLEKGGMIDALSIDLIQKIETNEKSVSDQRTMINDVKNNELDRTIN